MARDDLKGRLALFADGADDVLSAPYDPAELLARVMAVLHRSYRQEPVMKPVIEVDGMVIDIMNRTVTLPGHEAHLTAVELAILYLMAASPGAVLSRSDIAAHVWGPAHVTESNIIDRHIRNLRVKLNNSWREPRYIFTLPGQGYRFGREQGQQSPGDQRPE
jgi:two-component system KDP operon response regulator KdpE